MIWPIFYIDDKATRIRIVNRKGKNKKDKRRQKMDNLRV